jgi:translation initiation factor 1
MPGLFAGTPLERPVTCERCAKPVAECGCPRTASGRILLPRDQPARVRRERRAGKFVTVISGLDPVASDLKALVGELKRSLATGGTLSGGDDPTVELQGDHRDRIVEILKARGYPAKPAGG